MESTNKNKLEKLLAQFKKLEKNIPFNLIVPALFDTEVKKFNPKIKSNKENLEKIATAMCKLCKDIQKNPIKKNRPNEVGNAIEPFVIDALKENCLKASIPKTQTGKIKRQGYPDIKIETDAVPIYLEVKTYSKERRGKGLRSFYLSPTKNPKIIEDAFHLLVGFEMMQKNKEYTPVAFEIIDLYDLDCDIKLECNSDNKRLYQEKSILSKG